MTKLNARFTLPLAASLLATIVAGPQANADINMMEASFKTSFIDLQIVDRNSSESRDLTLSRTYDSRSTYSGFFGFGWCSNLDVALTKKTDSFEITACGKSEEAKVSFDRETLLRKTSDGITQRFSGDDGRLIGLKMPGRPEVKILRARGSLPRTQPPGKNRECE